MSSAGSAFSLKLLGGCSLEGADGHLVTGRVVQRRRLACLALVAAAGHRGIPRDKLVAYLWPERDTEAARHFLSDTLYVLRTRLGEEALVTAGDSVALNFDVVDCDLVAFENALAHGDGASGAALYAGPFLDGFHISNAPDFERWADGERDRLGTVHARVLESLALEAERHADAPTAAVWWRQLAASRPYDSRVARKLVEAMYAAGDRTGAIRQVQIHTDLLRELDVEPDRDLIELAERLRSDPAVRSGGNGHPPPRLPDWPGPSEDRSPSLGLTGPDAASAVSAEQWVEAGVDGERLPNGEIVAAPGVRSKPYRRNRIARWAAVLLVLLGGGSFAIGRWKRSAVSLPELEHRVSLGDWEGAYRLAKHAGRSMASDSTLERLRWTFSWQLRIESTPAGARVLRREYSAADTTWEVLGVTPIEATRLPFGASWLRFELAGYETADQVAGYVSSTGVPVAGQSIAVRLDRVGTIPNGMVRVPGWSERIDDQRLHLGDFLIDRYEITNRQYKDFVRAGGYHRRDLWQYAFIREGKTLTWERAMGLFTDQTGRPGPAIWEGGDYPEGQDDYPVGGLSWYEAAAYARFVGKDLPTVHHWRRAVGEETMKLAWLIPLSNVERKGAAPVGRFRGMSWYGAFDMVGNVREWCLNETHGGRTIQGGAWNEPWEVGEATFGQPPFDRSPTNGIRLAKYLDPKNLQLASRVVEREPFPDFGRLKPVPDTVFSFYRRAYEYDRIDLQPVLERADTTADWIREKISFNAAYGSERAGMFLYLPRTARPPYQTIVFFPGDAALGETSIDHWRTIQLDFAIEAGRAVALPVFKWTFDRGGGTMPHAAFGSNTHKERIIQWAKDLRRSVDYLETRPDLDAHRLAYYGYSWGGYLAPVMLAVEPRFQAAVVYVGGFVRTRIQPEADPVTFAPRVSTPVLLLSGKYDDVDPLEASARPMFQLLGTPAERKRHVVSEGGHFVPRPQLIRETLAWFDRYLGPVAAPMASR